MPAERPRVLPPWLVALDAAGALLLGLGLHAHYVPSTPLGPYRLGLLALGGAVLVAAAVSAVVLVLRRRVAAR